MKKLFFFFSILSFITYGCSKSNGSANNGNGGGGGTVDCSNVAKAFADVSPIFQNTCATNSGCHGSGSLNGPGPLLSFQQIFNARVSIRSAVASGLMPKGSTLPADQKNSILCWIDGGAPNN